MIVMGGGNWFSQKARRGSSGSPHHFNTGWLLFDNNNSIETPCSIFWHHSLPKFSGMTWTWLQSVLVVHSQVRCYFSLFVLLFINSFAQVFRLCQNYSTPTFLFSITCFIRCFTCRLQIMDKCLRFIMCRLYRQWFQWV